jgi:hypothetical protein
MTSYSVQFFLKRRRAVIKLVGQVIFFGQKWYINTIKRLRGGEELLYIYEKMDKQRVSSNCISFYLYNTMLKTEG